MAQLMPLLLTVSSFSKIQIGLPFWYRLTRVVPEKRAYKRVCVCLVYSHSQVIQMLSALQITTVSIRHKYRIEQTQTELKQLLCAV